MCGITQHLINLSKTLVDVGRHEAIKAMILIPEILYGNHVFQRMHLCIMHVKRQAGDQ